MILHELCNLAEHNHSERFYQRISQVMPDWESRKEVLDNMAARLFS
ncbi:MAG: M48 family metallopeptidase [Proteobacteria bacterium]|nr:M48 family metallopeptidase [Pseudomonadota bacterium]MDA1256075.1 M48 family metallopeptidase [Pseudomonadota bacterium]